MTKDYSSTTSWSPQCLPTANLIRSEAECSHYKGRLVGAACASSNLFIIVYKQIKMYRTTKRLHWAFPCQGRGTACGGWVVLPTKSGEIGTKHPLRRLPPPPLPEGEALSCSFIHQCPVWAKSNIYIQSDNRGHLFSQNTRLSRGVRHTKKWVTQKTLLIFL